MKLDMKLEWNDKGFRRILEDNKISVKDLAIKLQLDKSQVNRLIKTGNFKIHHICIILDYMNITFEELLKKCKKCVDNA